MRSITLWQILRVGLAVGLVGLTFFSPSLFSKTGVKAGLESPALWQDDDYPPPDGSQPFPTDAYPPPDQTQQLPTQGTLAGTLTPSSTTAFTQTPIPGPATITPSAVATGLPTASPTPTLATTPSITPQVSPVAGVDGAQGGFRMDWGFYWIGFAIPFLVGSGVVLYLLDRRPDLFKPRSKP